MTSHAPDPPDPDLVTRILAELARIPRGPIDPAREPPYRWETMMETDKGGCVMEFVCGPAPCPRCGTMDLHTLDQCAAWTAQVMAGQQRTDTRATSSSAHHEVEGMMAVPDTSEPGESLLSAVQAVQAANRRRLEQLARDLARTPNQALKMRVAELLAHREQCCAGESDCYADWELADLRWVLARRAESAGSIPGAAEFGEGDPEHDGPVRDGYGCRWFPAVRPGDGFRGWVHRLPGSNLAAVWMTWGQLTIQRGKLTAVDADRLDVPAPRL